MKVVLLGPNGQLGHDIRAAHEGAGESFELLPLARDTLDVAVPGEVERVLADFAFDALVNCTSYHKTDEVEDNGTYAFEVNAHAVKSMAAVCRAKNARFVHISTDYVFGGDSTRTTPLQEDDPIAPVNVYGASKAMGEILARLAWKDVLILRVASLFGVAGASGKGGNFVETMIRLGRERGHLRVVNDQIMSPTATADVAGVIVAMLTGGYEAGTYHVVNSGQANWFEFAQEIVRLVGVDAIVEPCTSEEYPTRAARPRYSALDNARLTEMFGSLPTWRNALRSYLQAKGHLPTVDSSEPSPR